MANDIYDEINAESEESHRTRARQVAISPDWCAEETVKCWSRVQFEVQTDEHICTSIIVPEGWRIVLFSPMEKPADYENLERSVLKRGCALKRVLGKTCIEIGPAKESVCGVCYVAGKDL